MVKAIYTILEKAGYNCDAIGDEKWEDLNQEWEDECDEFLKESIESRNKEIVSEWAYRCGVKKK